MELNDLPVVITGGASGLGEGAARVLASAGAKVAVFDLQVSAGEAVARDIGGVFVKCDLTSETQLEEAFRFARESHGPCAVLVNCAGIALGGKVISKSGVMPLSEFSKVININLVGSFNALRLAANEIKDREIDSDGQRGVIVNTASVAAFEGQIGQTAYSASKGGVVSMTLPAARELATYGIRVNTIAPGLFMTPMMQGLPPEVQKSLEETLPFPKRLGHPKEFGELVKHIVMNPIINGEVIRLDSALRMAPR